MNKVVIGRKVADDLFEAEGLIDDAYAAIGRLAATLSVSRKDMRLAAPVGDAAFGAIGQAMGQVAAARAEIVRAHAELSRVQRKTGLETVDFGGLDKPEDFQAPGHPRGEVRRIA